MFGCLCYYALLYRHAVTFGGGGCNLVYCPFVSFDSYMYIYIEHLIFTVGE